MTRVIPTALWRFTGTCINQHEFTAHEFPDFQYGNRLIRTSDPQEIALVEAIECPDFDEIGNMVVEIMAGTGRKNQAVSCFEKVFGAMCDPSPSGKQYDFTEKARCPICCTTEVIRYGPGKLPQTDIVDLPCIAYKAWRQLNNKEKKARLRNALREVGCLS
jgi:hypothetical protein